MTLSYILPNLIYRKFKLLFGSVKGSLNSAELVSGIPP